MRLGVRVALAAMLTLAPNLAWAGEPSAHDREEAKRAYTDARKLTKEGKRTGKEDGGECSHGVH